MIGGPDSPSAGPDVAVPTVSAVVPARSLWFDVVTFVWPVLLFAGSVYWSHSREADVVRAAATMPPRIMVIDELALITKVVREENIQDVAVLRTRMTDLMKPYTDKGYVVISELSVVAAPDGLVLPNEDLGALYERGSK